MTEAQRDCEHGRQRGKCADCDVIALEAENKKMYEAYERAVSQHNLTLDELAAEQRDYKAKCAELEVAWAERDKFEDAFLKTVADCGKLAAEIEGWKADQKENLRNQVELHNANKALVEALPKLDAIATWLENGCDAKEAAKELRFYESKINAALAQHGGEK